MGRIILVIGMFVAIVGCTPTIKTEVQEVMVPVMYCPAPPVIERPTLSIHQMTKAQASHPGELVKHYKATVKELQGYSIQLERIITQYDDASKTYEGVRDQLLQPIKPTGSVVVPQ